MTEDANNTELTRAYRDLATESTPRELDDRVLRMAARGTRSRYGIARTWMRPVAWAATIGLCLAIVLEVMQVIPPAPESGPAADSAAAPEQIPADEVPERLEPESAKRQDTAEMTETIDDVMKRVPANPGGGAAEELGARRAVSQDKHESQENRPVELDDANAFAAKDIRILEEAEMQARQRSGEPGVAALIAVPSEAAETPCDEAARTTAESWYECVVGLRETGQIEFAAIELDALRQAYPDFEVPAPDE